MSASVSSFPLGEAVIPIPSRPNCHECPVDECIRGEFAGHIRGSRRIGGRKFHTCWVDRHSVEPILGSAHAKTAVVRYGFPGLSVSNPNCALDMWWLALALFLLCIIEVGVSVADSPQLHSTKGAISVLV